jgi:hypothetical protein
MPILSMLQNEINLCCQKCVLYPYIHIKQETLLPHCVHNTQECDKIWIKLFFLNLWFLHYFTKSMGWQPSWFSNQNIYMELYWNSHLVLRERAKKHGLNESIYNMNSVFRLWFFCPIFCAKRKKSKSIVRNIFSYSARPLKSAEIYEIYLWYL